jgi:hypothetical protein
MTTNKFSSFTAAELGRARAQLSRFVLNQAEKTALEFGFGWRPASRVPLDLGELQREFRMCHISGLPLRVMEGFVDQTVFDCPSTKWAMRFVHDTQRVWLKADFSTKSELEIGSWLLDRAKVTGLQPGSLPYALLMAETVGQTFYEATTGRFVTYQLDFAIDCILFDFEVAVSREMQRTLERGAAS